MASTKPGEAKYCQICLEVEKNIVAEYYCVDCENHICEACKAKHAKHPALRKHVLEIYAPAMDRSCMCNKHKTRQANSWCESCRVPICSACTVAFHDDHKTDSIQKYQQEVITPLKKVQGNVLRTQQKLSDSKTSMAKRINTIDTVFKATKAKIKIHGDELKKRIDDQTVYLISKMEESCKTQKETLQHNLNNEDNNITMLGEWKNKVNQTLAGSGGLPSFVDIKKLTKEGEQLTLQDAINSEDPMLFDFLPDTCLLNVGDLVVKNPTTSQNLFWKEDFSGGVQDVKFASADHLCIVQEKAIHLYRWHEDDDNFRLHNKTQLSTHVLRRAAAAEHTSAIYITCSSYAGGCATVHQFNMQSQKLVENSSQWPKKMFSSPYGLALTSTGNLVVGDLDAKPPQIFVHRPDGSRLVAFNAQSSAKPQVPAAPMNLACEGKYIYASDRESHCIFLYDIHGNRQITIGQAEPGDEDDNKRLYSPWGVTVDDLGHVIVADMDKGRITEFGCRGRFIGHPLSKLSALKKPFSIDFAKRKTMRLLAVRDGSSNVKVFVI